MWERQHNNKTEQKKPKMKENQTNTIAQGSQQYCKLILIIP